MDVQNVYESCEKRTKYASKYIVIFVDDKVWRIVYWLTTQYPKISINPEKWMNSSKSYWEKKGNLELEVDVIMEKAQQKALNIMEILSRLWLTLEGAIAYEENQQEKKERVQCSEKTITRTAIFTKRYDVSFKENGGNF